jgi:uncharacterized protein YjbI with pentapeptide repeats
MKTIAPRIAPHKSANFAELSRVSAASITPELSLDSALIIAGGHGDSDSGGANPAESHLDWSKTSFLNVEVRNVSAASLELMDARLSGSEVQGVAVPSLEARGVSVETSVFVGCRFGVLKANDATLRSVEFVGCKIDYLNVRSAKFRDVRFSDCVIGDFDGIDADMTRVDFLGTSIAELSLHGARLRDVDVRASRLSAIADVSGLSGVTMTSDQTRDLADVFARHLGIRVEEER